MAGFSGSGETIERDGAFAKFVIGRVFTSAKVYFLNSTVASCHTDADSGSPCHGESSFFAFAEVAHTQVYDNVVFFIHEGQLRSADVVIKRIVAGPFVEGDEDDILNRKLGTGGVLLCYRLIWSKVQEPIVHICHITFGGDEGSFDHHILIHTQHGFRFDQRIVLHLVYSFPEITFQLVLFTGVKAVIEASGFGGSTDDVAMTIVQNPGICREIVHPGKFWVHRDVCYGNTGLILCHFVSFTNVNFTHFVVVHQCLRDCAYRGHSFEIAVILSTALACHYSSIYG